MPKKSHKVAARQAQLSTQKRKTTPRTPSGTVTKTPASQGTNENQTRSTTEVQERPRFAYQSSRPMGATQTAIPTSTPRSQAYRFAGTELRRIAIVTCVILAALAGAVFILR